MPLQTFTLEVPKLYLTNNFELQLTEFVSQYNQNLVGTYIHTDIHSDKANHKSRLPGLKNLKIQRPPSF